MSIFQNNPAKVKRRLILGGAALLAVISVGTVSRAAIIRRARAVPGQAGMVSLPYMVGDNQGNQWMVYQNGMLQMQGNFPVYSQGAQLNINGSQPNMQNNMGRVDDKTGELVLENMMANSFTVTRRMLFNTDESYVRIIDVIKNQNGADQQLNLQITSNLNYGVQVAQMIADPKKKDQNIAWVAQINGPGRGAIEVFAGKNSKVAPSIVWPQGNNFVQATLNYTVPANKEIAIVHFHGVAMSQDAGIKWVNSMKEEKLLADVPKELRKIIVNFPARANLIGDLEVLRGDVLDAVELRSGDRFNGNLTEQAFKLDTFYGTVELPVDKVVGIVNAGQYRPRQLIVTADGQIFGGNLQKQTIELQLSSGQKTQIPLSQISRVGYRKRAGETDDSAADQQLQPPYVLMSSGDRVGVVMPATPIEVVTRYGKLQLSPDVISSIAFTSEDSGVHTINLTDGSKFSGLVTLPEFEMKLTTGGTKDQTVKFPISAMNRLVVKNRGDDKDDSAPTLSMKKDDQLIATLQGTLQMDTSFDTITLNAPELRALIHPKENAPDVSVTTWDGTVFSGQLHEREIKSHLASGVDVTVPVALIQAYTNPGAAAPSMMVDRIKAIVANLNADEWKARDAAEKQLVEMGPGVSATIKSMRDSQPPEAQQRIDSVLTQLEKLNGGKGSGAATPPPVVAPVGDQ